MSNYELERLQNIARNRAILAAMGMPVLAPPKVKSAPRKPAASKKRKAPTPSSGTESEGEEPSPKVTRVDAGDDDGAADEGGRRRSQRNRGKTIDYKALENDNAKASAVRRRPRMVSVAVECAEAHSEGKVMELRTQNPRSYGHIPGVPVGTWWETRKECSIAAVHAPFVAGISGGPGGAYSVALSGGYEDDIDLGNAFTFTGSGGRDLKGTKNKPKNLRTAPQSSDQTFENSFNKALQISCKTKKPVRVIRGYKLPSEFAPAEGYRYDGLYTVEKAWMDVGEKGFKVCKFALKRLPGQPPIQFGDNQDYEEDNEEDDEGQEGEGSDSD